MRNIECNLEYDNPNPFEVSYFRVDTGELVKTRALSESERQQELPTDVVQPGSGHRNDRRKTASMPDGLPSSLHTEITVLGACLLDAAALRAALDKLTAPDFHLDSHQRIFRAMGELAVAGTNVDYITTWKQLERKHELDTIGGPAYLASLAEGIPRNAKIEDYIRIIKEESVKRRVLKVFDSGMLEVSDGLKDVKTVISSVGDELQALQSEDVKYELKHVSDIFAEYGSIDDMYATMATTQGINTGIVEFDRLTMGYQPKSLVILAARPKMGKTMKMINDAYHSAVIQGKKTAVFTLEQDKNDLLRRMLSSVTRIPYAAFKSGNLTREQRDAIMDAQARIMEAPLYITDQPNLTATRVCSMCRWMAETIGLDISYTDQLSRLKLTDVERKGRPRREEIGEQTNIYKLTAQQLNIPMVLLCQLRRFDGKGVARPTMDNLKDSGDIEEDADLVEILHRPKYYDSNSTEDDEIIIGANREGETGVCKVKCNAAIMRWEDIVENYVPQQGRFDDSY